MGFWLAMDLLLLSLKPRFLTYAIVAAKLSGDTEENNYYLVSYEG